MKSFHRLALVTALLAACPAYAVEEVYRTVGPDGSVIYSDTPSPDAEKLLIEGVQTVDSVPPPPSTYVPPEQEASRYTSVEIISPANDETLRPEDQDVAVTVAVLPQFAGQDTIVLYLDGNEYASGKSPSFSLGGLERGTHQLRAVIKGPDGKIQASSGTVSFHVQRAAVTQKQPPPKPAN